MGTRPWKLDDFVLTRLQLCAALGVELGDKPAFPTYLAASGRYFAYLAHSPWPEYALPVYCRRAF